MADVELVIKIPEGAYNLLKTSGVDWLGAEHILDAVSKGAPLPKGHGKLKDVDKIEALLDLDKADNEFAKALKNIIENVPTIIEADKAESEE